MLATVPGRIAHSVSQALSCPIYSTKGQGKSVPKKSILNDEFLRKGGPSFE